MEITVYPNPSRDIATFTIEGLELSETLTFRLYSSSGQLLRQQQHRGAGFDFGRGELSEGLYFYTLETAEGLLGSGKLILLGSK